ncbi:antitoxin VbhA family protein [Actinomyces capricornis]|uniref:antitoxin VbhA family protein n=1 Tax=Actinomyces capricornis TaxID=2755559 RepID=UPI001CC464D1
MTTAELNHRKRIVRAVIGSQELEGAPVSTQTKRVLDAFARGEATGQDLRVAIQQPHITDTSAKPHQ